MRDFCQQPVAILDLVDERQVLDRDLRNEMLPAMGDQPREQDRAEDEGRGSEPEAEDVDQSRLVHLVCELLARPMPVRHEAGRPVPRLNVKRASSV